MCSAQIIRARKHAAPPDAGTRSTWLLFSLLGLLLHGPAEGIEVGDLLRQGDSAFSRGEYTIAARKYSDAIDLDSKTPLLYTKRAAAYISLRQNAQALRDFDRAVDIDEKFLQGYLNRGKLLRQLCQFADAEQDFVKVLELRPSHKTAANEVEAVRVLKALLNQVQQQYAASNWDGARKALLELYKDSADCIQAQLLEAKIWVSEANHEQAVAITGRILKSDPSNIEALLLRGKAYWYMGDNSLAKRHCAEVLKYDPEHKEARTEFRRIKDYDNTMTKAEEAFDQGDWAAAESLFAKSVAAGERHDVMNVKLLIKLCKSRYNLGKHHLAEEACRSGLRLAPGSEEYLGMMVRITLELEQFEEAARLAREAVQQHQQNGELHQLLREAEKRLKMSLRKDYYKILGVSKDASDREIKKAYRDLARKYHPDKAVGSEEDKKVAEDKFRDIAESYEVLIDDEKRGRYDRGEDLHEEMQQHHHHHGFQQFHQGGAQFHFQWG